jgi:hypothetical protein
LPDVISTLINLSRPPQPSEWAATLQPLARRAAAAELQHAAHRVEHRDLADGLALIEAKALVQKITPGSMPLVGKLIAAGKDLRAALDSDFIDLRDAVRTATSATKAPEFTAAVQRIEKYLPLAEGCVKNTDATVLRIADLVERLGMVSFVSDAIVVEKLQTPFFSA